MSHQTAARLTVGSYYKAKIENKNTDAQATYETIGDRKYIIFPGTDGARDWQTNTTFNSLVSPYQGEGYQGKVRVHRGFYQAYLSVREEVLKVANCDRKLILAGHSAGGAIAQIAAVDINYQLDKPVETITFGSPACGNKYWQQSASSRIKTNSNYIIPFDLVPFSLLFYHHVTPFIWLKGFYLNPHCMSNYLNSL